MSWYNKNRYWCVLSVFTITWLGGARTQDPWQENFIRVLERKGVSYLNLIISQNVSKAFDPFEKRLMTTFNVRYSTLSNFEAGYNRMRDFNIFFPNPETMRVEFPDILRLISQTKIQSSLVFLPTENRIPWSEIDLKIGRLMKNSYFYIFDREPNEFYSVITLHLRSHFSRHLMNVSGDAPWFEDFDLAESTIYSYTLPFYPYFDFEPNSNKVRTVLTY